MSATNTTTHYNLPSFLPTDKPAWLVDWNGAMASIDAGIYQAQQTADTSGADISALRNTVTTLSGTVDSQGVTISTLSQSLTTAIGSINTINSLIGNGTPTTTDQTIIGAINEINARTGEAEGISYDNTNSGLSATNVQSAIDEVNALVDHKADKTDTTKVIFRTATAHSFNLPANASEAFNAMDISSIISDGYQFVGFFANTDCDLITTGYRMNGNVIRMTVHNIHTAQQTGNAGGYALFIKQNT